MDVIHTAIWVNDLETARSFYVDTLGLDELRSHTRNGITNIFVGGPHGAIQLRTTPDRTVPPEERTRMDHIALSVTDVDAACDRVRDSTSGTVTREPETLDNLGVRIAFITDPNDYAIEFVQQLE